MQILEVGSQVETCLMSDEDLNDLKGHIVCYNASSLRYTLELENGDMMSLQAKNIKAVVAANDKEKKVMESSSNPRAKKDDSTENAPSNVLNLANGINEKLHQKPFDIIAEGLYWWFILCFVCFPGSIIQLFFTVYKVYMHYWGTPEEEKNVIGYVHDATTATDNTTTSKKAKKKKLGVVITGCDSGFGKELAIQLLESKQEFVVFCGCLLEESVEQYKKQYGEGSAILPVKMDVTSDAEVQAAASVVSDWLLEDKEDEERHFLALVNNAGIGITGLLDWFEVSDFQKVFDVNYFGVIRCVKAFQPIFKGQATALDEKTKSKEEDKQDATYKYYPDSRIINVISSTGFYAPGPYLNAYSSSKHALEAFTNNLRQEMSMFHVKVIGVNPGFHDTPIIRTYPLLVEKTVSKITPKKREEYGDVFINAFVNKQLPPGFDSSNVVQILADIIVQKNPPIKHLIGMDSKYFFHPLSKLPTWFSYGVFFEKLDRLEYKSEEEYTPKIMMDKVKEMRLQKEREVPSSNADKKDQ